MVSAVCPSCKILLVEAKSSSMTDLGKAVNRAALLGAAAISNSYGTSSEFSGETTYDSYYNHPGAMVTVSSGDSGYKRFGYPAASGFVTAVGGTHLTRTTSTRGWAETAWSGAGAGCSIYEAKPAWQTDTGCSKRTVSDVSAIADPNTGVAVYDSFGSSGGANWYVFGGTSVSSPIVASIYALAGNAAGLVYGSYPYAHRSSLWDVTSGWDGQCRSSYLCTSNVGYDGPTGLGTPNGIGAF
jgi:subtilase family serine protease